MGYDIIYLQRILSDALIQILAKNCNSRWRYRGSKFDSIPYKPWNQLKIREIYMGQYQTLHPLYFGWELQLRVNFWQGPFPKVTLFENGTKSHNFTNLIFL